MPVRVEFWVGKEVKNRNDTTIEGSKDGHREGGTGIWAHVDRQGCMNFALKKRRYRGLLTSKSQQTLIGLYLMGPFWCTHFMYSQ